MFQLLYKNFVVCRRYLVLELILYMAVPILYALLVERPVDSAQQEMISTVLLLFISLWAVAACLMYLAQKESEHHGAVALLAASPYSRTNMVLANYLFAYILFGLALAILAIEGIFLPQLRGITPSGAGLAFLLVSLLVGISLPVVYRFGYDKARIVYFLVILLTPILVSAMDLDGEGGAELLRFAQGVGGSLAVWSWAAGVAVCAVSIFLSIRAFGRADLA